MMTMGYGSLAITNTMDVPLSSEFSTNDVTALHPNPLKRSGLREFSFRTVVRTQQIWNKTTIRFPSFRPPERHRHSSHAGA